MHKNIRKWIGFSFSSEISTRTDYKQFQRTMRTDLQRQAKAVNFELYSFHPNYYQFTAVLKNSENKRFVYICIPDVRFGQDEWSNRVLYRTMEHPTDWTGGRNHFGNWENIGELAYELTSG